MPNRLVHETSPYLRQHAHNPVDWFPWGDEARARARADDKPILLSIGYAACHWCHVMERESFENDATAALMNEHFVSIKVDREERPDVDAIYMRAVQAMTGHGGWPMTMFLTPEGVPFHGGTYYPPDDRPGMPSFTRVLRGVSDAYRNRRGDVEQTITAIRGIYHEPDAPPGDVLTRGTIDRALAAVRRQYDARNGGFGGAPKFPPTMVLEALLANWARGRHSAADARHPGAPDARHPGESGGPGADLLEMALHTFRAMARGGIYDQIGGGFARYAVDGIWLVPHFEKMLYDNALLIRFGVHLWQATGDDEVRRVTEATIDWLAREMRSPEGGFYSSLDADSEGHEGKFYVWSFSELSEVLGDDIWVAIDVWGATNAGNFEGDNILNVANTAEHVATRRGISVEAVTEAIDRVRRRLFDHREHRVRPGRDEKILTAWNGLAIRALAEAARAFDRDDCRGFALECGELLERVLVRDGRVLRSYKDGVARIAGVLEDHAALGLAELALYELSFDPVWAKRAQDRSDDIVRRFYESSRNILYDTANDHEQLITRPRDFTDNAHPSGTSLAVELLLRIADVFGDADDRRRAQAVLDSLAEPMARYPLGFGHALLAADMALEGATEVAIIGDPHAPDFAALARVVGQTFVPSLVLAGGAPSAEIPLLADRTPVEGRAAAYVCHSYVCQAPVIEPSELAYQLGGA